MKKIFIIFCLLFLIQTNANSKTKIMLFGDSLMAGYGLPQTQHLHVILEREIKDKNITFINASVSGDTTAGGLARIDWSLSEKPTIVVLGLGANDMLRGIDPKVVKQNLDLMIKKIKGVNAKIILAGMISPQSYNTEYKKAFDNIYPDLASEHKLIYFPFLLDGVALNPKLNLDDGKHPNAEGVKVIAKNLSKYILQAYK
ncbi:MAG: arylesterase [Candidatus Fonsibacter sp.]